MFYTCSVCLPHSANESHCERALKQSSEDQVALPVSDFPLLKWMGAVRLYLLLDWKCGACARPSMAGAACLRICALVSSAMPGQNSGISVTVNCWRLTLACPTLSLVHVFPGCSSIWGNQVRNEAHQRLWWHSKAQLHRTGRPALCAHRCLHCQDCKW